MEPLNKKLYDALQRKIGHVRIVDPGQHARITYGPTYLRGRTRMTVNVSGGEYYYVSCPECDDTRGRLEFSYLWATRDLRTRTELLHLVYCFNEDCIDDYEKQRALADKLLPNRNLILPHRRHRLTPRQAGADAPAPTVIRPELAEPPTPKPVRLPEGFVAGKSRIRSARARNYLKERDFDPKDLEARWDVGYCRESSSPPPKFSNRLVIPVYTLAPNIASGGGETKTVLAGWQARAVGEAHDDRSKYLTAAGMKKSHLLYGLPQAVETEGPVVICEGVTGVWRLMTNGVAILGKSISPHQRALMLRYFSKPSPRRVP